jgi:hypothetical protein
MLKDAKDVSQPEIDGTRAKLFGEVWRGSNLDLPHF